MIGRKLGKYEIIDRIGRGGMAEVYRGYHAALDRYVAIKLLHSFLADDPEFKTRFEREARSVARLKHPNIVQVYDFEYDEDSDTYYMVMEFVNGPTLKDSLFDLAAAGSRLPIPETVHIIKTAARALAYAHDRKMIHRDVKPANLMLDLDGRVVLTDFGIAKIVTGAHITTSGGIVGTPAYMAPEQGLGQVGDERSDLYSLGVILYQLVTGRLPFDANTPLAIILKHFNEPLPLPSQFVPDLPTDLETVIRRALQKDPNTRYQSAHEFAAALDALQMASYARPVTASRQGPDGAASPQGAEDGDTPILPLTDLPGASPGISARPARRYTHVLSTAAFVLALAVTGLVAFGRNRAASAPATPLSESIPLASTATITAAAVAQSPTLTLTPTRDLSPTPTPTATPSRTPTPVLTSTPTSTATRTPTPNLTLTAAFLALQRETAATRTPDIPGTLAACDLEYIVVAPDKHNRPPSPTDFDSLRLVRANSDFEFEIVLRNTGTCAWPEDTRLSYNAALTENPDESVDLTALAEACPEYLRPGLNFARQQQSNFFIKQSVGITGDSPPLLFTGTAPRAFGCYYGVWELIYANTHTRIGRPLVLTIRAWGSG